MFYHNSNLNVNFSLRKEFGVPIPFTNKTAASAKFVSFLDINGNNIKDKDEVSIQNIVVKLNKHEVITNFEGEASIKNLQQGNYKLEILPLPNKRTTKITTIAICQIPILI